MDFGFGKAFEGLSAIYGKRESQDRSMAIMEKMQQDKRFEEARNLQNQQMMNEYENKIMDYAKDFLEYDRSAIMKDFNSKQEEIKSRIKREYNGDVAKFMANGGLRQLNEFTNSVMYSDKALGYDQNKKNLVNLMKAMNDKNTAHLIPKSAIASFEAYQQNQGGSIIWEGLLSDIDYPQTQGIEHGEQVTADQILGYKNNYQKIVSNYMKENPGSNMPSQDDLLEYVNSRYVAVGTGRDKYSNRLKGQQKQNKQNTQKTEKPEVVKPTYSGGVHAHVSKVNKYRPNGITFKEIMSGEINDKFPSQYLGGDWDKVSDVQWQMWDDDIIIAGGKKLYEGADYAKMASMVNSDNYDEATKTFTLNGSDIFTSTNGVKGDVGDTWEVKPLGMTTAFKGKNLDGEEAIVMLKPRKKGESQKDWEDRNYKIMEGFDKGSFKMIQVMAYMDTDTEDEIIYQEFDTDKPLYANAIKEGLGDRDDLTEKFAEDKKNAISMAENDAEAKNKAHFSKTSTLSALSQSDFDTKFDSLRHNSQIAFENKSLLQSLALSLAEQHSPSGEIEAYPDKDAIGNAMTKLTAYLNSEQGEGLRLLLQKRGLTQREFFSYLDSAKGDGAMNAKRVNSLKQYLKNLV